MRPQKDGKPMNKVLLKLVSILIIYEDVVAKEYTKKYASG